MVARLVSAPRRPCGLAAAAVGLLLFLLAPADARAEGGLEITPWAGYASGGTLMDAATSDVLGVGDSAAFGFVLGLRTSPRSSYELLYSFQGTSLGGYDAPGSSGPRDLDIHYLHVGGRYEYPQGRLLPFLSGGLGLTALVPAGGDAGLNASLSLGGGVRIPLAARVGLRLEGRGFLTLVQDGTEIFCSVSSGEGACAVGAQGDALGQIELIAGVYVEL